LKAKALDLEGSEEQQREEAKARGTPTSAGVTRGGRVFIFDKTLFAKTKRAIDH
jgi:hypothetical protein